MEVAHLGIVLDAKGVVLISPNSQTKGVNSDDLVPGWSFEDMEFYHALFGCQDYFEFGQPHLKHHVLR